MAFWLEGYITKHVVIDSLSAKVMFIFAVSRLELKLFYPFVRSKCSITHASGIIFLLSWTTAKVKRVVARFRSLATPLTFWPRLLHRPE